MPSKPSKPKSLFDSGKPGKDGEAYTMWANVDVQAIKHLLTKASQAGGTVQFGCTQNQSAAVIRIYHGGKGENFYAGSVEEIDDLCRHYAELFDGLLE